MNLNFDYRLPYNEELVEPKLKPYRTNNKLKSKLNYLFSHPSFKHNQLFKDVSTSGSRQLTSDMSTIAVACMRHFVSNQSQYGHNLENIQWQIIVRMWKQTFRHTTMQLRELDEYHGTKAKLLSVNNMWLEELYRTVVEEDYIQHNDDMVKRRYIDGKPVGLRDRIQQTREGSKHFEELCKYE